MPDYTVKWPLEFSNLNNGFETIDSGNLNHMINFNLKNIILTEPGERLFFPNFGVGIKRYLFEQSNIDIELLSFKITSQVKRYAPYVTIQDLKINIEERFLNIALKYEVKDRNISDILNLDLTL
jgi:phage baseplate assembly protein W